MKDTRKLGGAGVFIFFMFFLNSADPTISEPGTGYLLLATCLPDQQK